MPTNWHGCASCARRLRRYDAGNRGNRQQGTVSIYKTPEGERAVMGLYDQMLARWPVPYTTAMLPTRHGDTFVISQWAG